MTISVRAPATSANLGSGFDCVGVALDLWNELEVSEGGEPADPEHLGVRAFALLASPEGRSFHFTDRIPRARGLGSSAAVIALGLVAGARAAGREAGAEELLALGLPLEGHADNLAAALAGGVCLTWDDRIERIADAPPAEVTALIPAEEVDTQTSRRALPTELPHADAAWSAGRAAMLGAALASGDTDLFAAALGDRLHEPYRSPFLADVRERLPRGALGATLSGSGPTVIVWSREPVADELRALHPGVEVLQLAASAEGAA